jgi:hypothetical protein
VTDGAPSPATADRWDAYVERALQLVDAARERGLTLRLVGSVACRIRCAGFEATLDALDRENPPDIDLVCPADDRTRVRSMFLELGFAEDRDLLVAMEGRRMAFDEAATRLHVDLFVDRLEFCHPIDVTKRFGLESPTLPLADLVLSKLQIVEINQKDLKDLLVLLLAHDLGTAEDPERIDVARIAALASEEWGLFHTMSLNVERVRALAESTPVLDEDSRRAVLDRLGRLWAAVEAAPKSLKWKVRSKVGTRVQWYQDVSEQEPAFE